MNSSFDKYSYRSFFASAMLFKTLTLTKIPSNGIIYIQQPTDVSKQKLEKNVADNNVHALNC